MRAGERSAVAWVWNGMLASMKRLVREKLRGRPGHRFQEHYQRSKKEKASRSRWGRLLNLILAIAALAVALFLSVFPGPAIPFYFLAGMLLASESLLVARFMDWLEVRLRAVWKWGRQRWRHLSTPGRAAVVLLGACCSAAGMLLCWRLIHR